jgi:hypothetical protein
MQNLTGIADVRLKPGGRTAKGLSGDSTPKGY